MKNKTSLYRIISLNGHEATLLPTQDRYVLGERKDEELKVGDLLELYTKREFKSGVGTTTHLLGFPDGNVREYLNPETKKALEEE